MEQLIVWRMVQGAAMGAAVMGARAIVRDLYTPLQGARIMSKGLTGLAFFACLSVPLGSLMTELFNWRAALLVLALFGATSLLLVTWRYQETLSQKNLQALEPATLWRNWRLILRHPTFQAYSALSAASYCGLFTLLAGSSFVFIDVLGFSKTQYGLLMFFNSVVYMLGTLLCRRLLTRFSVQKSVALAGGLSLLGGTLMGTLAILGVQHSLALIVPMFIFMLGHGIHQPCGQSGAVGPFPQAAGTASALNGFLMMVAAFFVGGWLGTHLDGTVFPMVKAFCLWSALIALTAWTLVQTHEPKPPLGPP
jgi:DHA1 family bicyclomycin/chloramphenicol resistance-like MFS transporter